MNHLVTWRQAYVWTAFSFDKLSCARWIRLFSHFFRCDDLHFKKGWFNWHNPISCFAWTLQTAIKSMQHNTLPGWNLKKFVFSFHSNGRKSLANLWKSFPTNQSKILLIMVYVVWLVAFSMEFSTTIGWKLGTNFIRNLNINIRWRFLHSIDESLLNFILMRS